MSTRGPGGNRPIYRTRNHAVSCECDSCRRRRAHGTEMLKVDAFIVVALLVTVGLACALMGFVLLVDRHPHAVLAVFGVIAAVLLFFLIRANIRRDRAEQARRGSGPSHGQDRPTR